MGTAAPTTSRAAASEQLVFGAPQRENASDGVAVERCYGCGRCLSACPYGLISAVSHRRNVADIVDLLNSPHVDAIEIHTLPGHAAQFQALWAALGSDSGQLKLVAVSLPDLGLDMGKQIQEMFQTMLPGLHCPNLWQLDGRPMSGDLGPAVTAKAAVKLAEKVTMQQKVMLFCE